ncbi:hypothetical protein [uncultured Clostridium sp.]|uniref:hypothetical protein n=1 Tax=uncultured Clostridium sp. TaxID=59620 RepID=UPI0026008811|nr:hypothetical protein [uncultured Clostridium sp.]
MNLKKEFISDIEEYKIFKELIDDCVYINNMLPNQVFNKRYTKYLFNNFYRVLSEEFGDEIKILADKTNDDMIILAVIDPDPISYYYHYFKYTNWLKLSTKLTSKDYLELLEQVPEGGNEADSIFFYSNNLIMAPLSQKWVIWLDREYDVCIIAYKDKFIGDIVNLELDNWESIDDTVDQLLLPCYEDIERLNIEKKEFCKNYTNNK